MADLSYHKNLMSLTHASRGVIYYPDDGVAYAIDWSGIAGFPEIRTKGCLKVTGNNIDLPDVDPVRLNDLLSAFSGVVSFMDFTPDLSFAYKKGEPWRAYSLIVDATNVVVLVSDLPVDTMSVGEYAKKHNIPIDDVYWYCRTGKIPCMKDGRSWVIFDDI